MNGVDGYHPFGWFDGRPPRSEDDRYGGTVDEDQWDRVVVVGASAGGVDALSRFVHRLPATLGAPVLIVLHVPAGSYSALPDILAKSGPLPTAHAVDGERLCPGRIFVAPPDHHLSVHGHQIQLDAGPKENGSRPSIDHLFVTAAAVFGASTIAVVLSGMLQDGTVGLQAVVDAGGRGLVQDPSEAAYPSMPGHAAACVPCADVLPLDRLVDAVIGAVAGPTVAGAMS